jgi:hypothetical protein
LPISSPSSFDSVFFFPPTFLLQFPSKSKNPLDAPLTQPTASFHTPSSSRCSSIPGSRPYCVTTPCRPLLPPKRRLRLRVPV